MTVMAAEGYSSKVRDQEISLEIFGFVRVPHRVFFWKFLSILFFPLLPLCLYWKPNWWTKAAYKKTPIQFATHLLVYRAEILELVDIFIIKGWFRSVLISKSSSKLDKLVIFLYFLSIDKDFLTINF